MIMRPKRSIKPPPNLNEYIVAAELDEEKTSNFKNEKSKMDDGKSLFKCKKCGVICKNKSEIIIHIKRHKGKENYVCEECGKTLSSLQAFSEHSNIHKNIRPYRCDVCGHESRQISVHSRHLMTHEDAPEKLFRCTVCSKSFKQKDYLKQHIRKHVGEKPYECNQCSKKFSAKSELNRHSISHSSARPFSCQHCNKSFKLKHNLNAHVRAHVKSQVWKCSLCKDRFPQQYLMEKHKRLHTEVVQHLELIKNDPRNLSITSRPLDRRKVLHHQKMSLPPKLDLNDSANAFNSKMSLGLSGTFIPISVIANSFGTGNYIRMKIVDKFNGAEKCYGNNLNTFNGLTNAVLVENKTALNGQEWENAVLAVDEEENESGEKPSETEISSDFVGKFDAHFESFDLFKAENNLEDKISWLQTMIEIIKEISFPNNNSVYSQLHSVIAEVQNYLMDIILEQELGEHSLALHAPSCESCDDDYSKDESNVDAKNEMKSNKIKIELRNPRKNDEDFRRKLKTIYECNSALNECLQKYLSSVLDI